MVDDVRQGVAGSVAVDRHYVVPVPSVATSVAVVGAKFKS